MKKVCVITGGGSGIGLATARLMGQDHYVIIVGRTTKKLEAAREELRVAGVEAEAFPCDIADRDSVDKLAARAKEIGTVSAVIHAAGLSPHMGDPRTILAANALGTINVNDVFFQVMEAGSCLIDVASMAGHLVPNVAVLRWLYRDSRIDQDAFMAKMMTLINLCPKSLRPQMAYAISKNFVVWYARTDAARFGQKGVRVLSVSPGSFETPMGELEKDDTELYTESSALKRLGHPEEMASLLAFCASDKPGYLTGVDILCDGGVLASGINPLKKVGQPGQSTASRLELQRA